MPQNKASTLLIEMAKIEDISMTDKHQADYRQWMQEIAMDPQGSFDLLGKTVEALPAEFEKERSRFLQIALEMDVSKEQKKELLENIMLDGRYANEKIENQTSKLMTFDLMIEHAGVEAAQEVLEKGNFKGELAKLMKAQLGSRKPA